MSEQQSRDLRPFLDDEARHCVDCGVSDNHVSNGIIMTTDLLFHGLQPQLGGRQAWCKLVTNVIQQSWIAVPSRPQTRKTEHQLGIAEDPLYLFAMRSEHAFGFVVFVLRMKVQSDAEITGATPFDSGGLWHGKVRARLRLTDAEKRAVFEENNIPLARFPDSFKRYVEVNYCAISDYIEGRPPLRGTPPITPHHPNSSRAWTWEVRIPKGVATAWAELVCGFITPEAMNDYSDWLSYDSAIEDAEAEYIHHWADSKMKLAPQGLSAYEFAQRSLLAGDIS